MQVHVRQHGAPDERQDVARTMPRAYRGNIRCAFPSALQIVWHCTRASLQDWLVAMHDDIQPSSFFTCAPGTTLTLAPACTNTLIAAVARAESRADRIALSPMIAIPSK